MLSTTMRQGGDSHDYGYSIITDSSGRILVTGYSRNASSNDDMAIWRYNSNGTLDTTFNGTGYVIHNNAAGGNSNDEGRSIVIDSSGRILVAGSSNRSASGNADMAIWRYNSNGTLDSTFNGTGYVVHNNAAGGNYDDYGKSITIDSSGKILVAGGSWSGSSYAYGDMVIWRYNPNGTLDTTFNGTGYVVHNNAAGGSSNDMGYSITTDSSGKIFVTGYSSNASGSADMAIWRYNSNGTLDSTFNGTGYLAHNNAAGGNGADNGYSIRIDLSGKILVAGNSSNASGNNDMTIWRYNSNGTLDTTFNGTGYVIHNNAAGGNSNDTGFSITIDTSGRILVTGYSSNASGIPDMAIWRYDSNGTLDTTFNDTGYVVHNNAAGGNNWDSGTSITMDSSGRILVTGNSKNATGNMDMVIWRYLADDTTSPTGSISINSSAVYTNATSASLSLACSDSDSGCSQMQLSNDNTNWSTAEAYAASKAWTLSSGDGTKTVYVKFKDTAGNWSGAYNDTISLDITAPTNGSLSATGGSGQVSLSWSGFSDSTSGINSYKVVYSTSSSPSSCSSGTQIYSSTGTSYTHASLSSGTTYYYRICAVDNTGNTSTGAIASATTQTSDTTAPTGSIFINSGAVSTNSTAVTLTLTCTDATGCAEMQFSNDNANWPTAEAYATSKAWTLSSGDGTKTVYVKFKDLAGNWSSAFSDTILLDTTAPATSASPAGGTYTSAQSVTLTCSDGTGSGCDKIYYTTDGTTPTTASTVYSTAISISATKTLKFFAKDLAGNQETVGTEVYTIDTISPELVLSTLSNGAVTNNSTLNLSGTVTDNTGIQGLTVNGNTVTVNADGSFSYAMVINEEANVINTTATDSAGNQTTDTRTITLDTAAPALTISTPADNSKTAVSVATVTGTIDENSTVTVILNNGTPQYASVTGNTFTLDIALASGVNTIEATATDTAGNTSTQKRTVTYDNAKPSLAITDPSQDIWTNQGSVTIRGTVSDALTTVLVSVMVDGNTYNPAVSNGQFEQTVTFTAEKTYTISVTATDEAGNTTTVQRNIICDATDPTTTASPAGGTYTSAQNVTLSGSETATISYTTDGTTPTTSSTVYTAPVSITKDTTLKFFAVDNAGNAGTVITEAYVITAMNAIDTTPPANASNLNASSNADGSISISWIVPTDSDLKGYNIYKDGTKINSQTVTTTTYKDSSVTIGATYTYKVTAIDFAGNESSGATKTATSTVQANTPPSAPSSVKEEDSGTGYSMKVIWPANTESDLAGYKVYWGTASWTYPNSQNIGNATSYTITGLTDGTKYYIAVTAYDTEGNESVKSIEATGTPKAIASRPETPTGLTVTPGNKYLTLSWTGVSNLTGYMVYIGEADGVYGTPVRTANTTHTFQNLENNRTYYVAVSSYDLNSGSRYTISSESERTASSSTPNDNDAPAAPSSLTATDAGTGGSIVLKWAREESFDIAGYVVAYKKTGNAVFEGITSTGVTWNYAVSGLTNGSSYTFSVYAYDSNGNFSDPSSVSATPTNSGSTADITPPGIPTLSAAPGNGKVTLMITPPSDTDIDHYNLYVYNLAAGKYMPLASINGLSYEHSTGVDNGKALVFVATAVDAAGNESGYSTTASAVPSGLPGDIQLEEDPPVLDRVDGYDVNEIAKGFGSNIGKANYNANSDLDGDGKVDGNDLLILGTNHGKRKE